MFFFMLPSLVCSYIYLKVELQSWIYQLIKRKLNESFVIFPAKIPKIFLVFHYNKLNVLGIWLLDGQTKTFDEVIFHRFLMFYRQND